MAPDLRPPCGAGRRADPGERRVAGLAAVGLSNKHVADQLYLSAATEGLKHTLDFYCQTIGSNIWNPQTADGPGTTYA